MARIFLGGVRTYSCSPHQTAKGFHSTYRNRTSFALLTSPTMYGWGHWSVEGTRGMLMHYQTKHAAIRGFDYVVAFDAIFNSLSS
jgi:hypothetical protein